MKKLIFILAVVGMTSCSKNCDDLEMAATNQYKNAIFNCNGNSAAVNEVTRQYNEKIKQIRKDCY